MRAVTMLVIFRVVGMFLIVLLCPRVSVVVLPGLILMLAATS